MIDAHFVLVFDARPKNKAVSAATECEREYTSLISRLKSAGLEATGRPGAKGSQEILVFVRCPQDKLRKELEAQRLSDWLNGIFSTRPDPRTKRDFEVDPLTPSEQLQTTFRLITGPANPTGKAQTPCAGVVPEHEPFIRVKSIFAPHDQEFNKRWIGQWTSFSHVLGIPKQELDMIKNHAGEAIALYFEFLRYYFLALGVPSAFGFIAWLSGKGFNTAYAALLVLWSVVFVEGWALKEKRLSVRWGTNGHAECEQPLTDFKPDHVSEGRPEYTWYKREIRILTSVPVLLAFAAGLACVITTIYTTEVFINEMYNGPGKQYLSLLPTILFAGIVPQVVAVWQKVALRLTRWENHSNSTSFDKSLTLKLFALNAVVSFGALTLTAYVYIPFGSLIMPHVHSLIQSHLPYAEEHLKSAKAASSTFNINAERLHNTLFALTTTTQVIGAVTELVVPLLTRLISKRVSEVQEKRTTNGSSKSQGIVDEADEHVYLERIRDEAALPPYDLFVDYAEMAIQFGYVTLWSVIWPLAPLMAFINNFFELRGDALKLTLNVRRATPQRCDTLGPWLDVFGLITWLAALTNSSLVYLYRPHADHSCDPAATSALVGVARSAMNTTANMLNSTVLMPQEATHSARVQAFATSNIHLASSHADGSRYASLRAVLFSALLVALASEHGYVLARAAIRHVLERLLWRGTEEEILLRHSEERLKMQYMDAMDLQLPQSSGIRSFEVVNRASPLNSGSDFWTRPDAGVAEIKRLVKQD